MSSADRSRTADCLADSEFHPSSFGHSHLPCVTGPARTTEDFKVSPVTKLFTVWGSTVSLVPSATLAGTPHDNHVNMLATLTLLFIFSQKHFMVSTQLAFS